MKKFGTNAREIANEGIPSIIELLEIGVSLIYINCKIQTIGLENEV